MSKEVSIVMKDITEGNRFQKVESLEKCLNGETFPIVKADNTKKLSSIVLQISNYDKSKMNKAIRNISFSLDVPLKSYKGEVFYYKSQEDLTDRWIKKITQINSDLYNLITDYFALPKITVMSKAVLRHNGKVIYSPESGKPITTAEWKKFVSSLQKFLDKHYNGVGERIILDSTVLGHLLDKMSQNNSRTAIRNKRLDDITWKNKKLDWIAENFKNMTNTLGESLTRDEQARIQVMSQSAAQRITKISNVMRDDIQQILIDGVKDRQSKSQVSQKLFDKMVGINRDIQKIADTEIENATNNAYVLEAVYNTPKGEKTYFERVEIIDDNTCDYCKRMNGKIALFSAVALPTDKINDPIAEFALWEGHDWDGGGKGTLHSYMGVFHPYCRGVWVRMNQYEIEKLEAKK